MGSRQNDKAISGLIRRLLSAGAGPSPGNCLATDELAAYFEHSHSQEEAARCEIHLSNCPRCRAQLVAMTRADVGVNTAALPAREARWTWNWRWLAPAAATLAVLAVWVALRPAKRVPQTASVPAVSASVHPSAPSAVTAAQGAPPQVAENYPAAPPAMESSRVLPRKVVTPKPGRENTLNAANGLRPPAGGPVAGFSSAKTAPSLADQTAVKEEAEATAANASVSPSAANQIAGAPAPPQSAQQGVAGEERSADLAQKNARLMAPRSSVQGVLGGTVTGQSVSKPLAQMLEVAASRTLVAAPDQQVIWRVGPAGSIELSENAGRTWQGQLAGTNEDLLGGSAVSGQICWVVGRAGTVLRTTDGLHWKLVTAPTSADLISIVARDAQTATATTSDGRKFSTQDGGKSWSPQD